MAGSRGPGAVNGYIFPSPSTSTPLKRRLSRSPSCAPFNASRLLSLLRPSPLSRQDPTPGVNALYDPETAYGRSRSSLFGFSPLLRLPSRHTRPLVQSPPLDQRAFYGVTPLSRHPFHLRFFKGFYPSLSALSALPLLAACSLRSRLSLNLIARIRLGPPSPTRHILLGNH